MDHPHAYGDKLVVLLCLFFCVGSSPRVWGQVPLFLFQVKQQGIIPTRMGTRKADILPLQIPLDHPHAYGDKRDSAPLSFTYSGSSPRVWGQEQALREDAMQQRIIPTRVGTSLYYML